MKWTGTGNALITSHFVASCQMCSDYLGVSLDRCSIEFYILKWPLELMGSITIFSHQDPSICRFVSSSKIQSISKVQWGHHWGINMVWSSYCTPQGDWRILAANKCSLPNKISSVDDSAAKAANALCIVTCVSHQPVLQAWLSGIHDVTTNMPCLWWIVPKVQRSCDFSYQERIICNTPD